MSDQFLIIADDGCGSPQIDVVTREGLMEYLKGDGRTAEFLESVPMDCYQRIDTDDWDDGQVLIIKADVVVPKLVSVLWNIDG